MTSNSDNECNITANGKGNKNLYKEELMEHFKNPTNKKKIENPDFSSGKHNPSCGDSLEIEGKVEKDKQGVLRIKDLGFQGSGCVISLATASMFTEHCIGKTVDEVLKMTKDDITNLLGIELGPIRIKCALLSLTVLQNALSELKNS